MVSGRPSSAVAPKVIATAASATTSGTSRSRLRNTSASTSAISTRPAMSSRSVEPASAPVRSSATTGAPVTVYSALLSFHCGICTASRTSATASSRCSSVRPGLSRTWISADSEDGKR